MAPEGFPQTPSRQSRATPLQAELDATLLMLRNKWDLGLPHPADIDWKSPQKNQDQQRSTQDRCLKLFRFCFFKKILDPAIEIFEQRAAQHYSAWVHKPRAERGVLPRGTGKRSGPVTDNERLILLKCLADTLQEQKELYTGSSATPLSTESAAASDVIPIPFSLIKPGTDKRSREELEEPFLDLIPHAKKAKKLEDQASRSFGDMAPPERGRSLRRDQTASRSANTSFADSEVSTIFSHPSFGPSDSINITQETVPDDDLPKAQRNTSPYTTFQNRNKSSDYASSSLERAMADLPGELSRDSLDFGIRESTMADSAEEQLKSRLEGIFPNLPSCLRSLPLCVMYEIIRVFLHAEVHLGELDAGILRQASESLKNYDTLWKSLKGLPALKEVEMPERCRNEVWDVANDGFQRGFYSVVFAGTLRFNATPDEPLFRLKLEPMKLDLSHRLGRRFGNDRFLEICIPSFTGKLSPQPLTELGDRGREIVYKWLIDSRHTLLGRQWKPFFVKPKERRSRKMEAGKESETAESAFRVYFFAVDGDGFVNDLRLIQNPEDGKHPILSIPDLLNRIRPTRKNVSVSYLKLFARTSLALSRNSATILLDRSQIVQKENILCGSEVMNDGAGRMSYSLAQKITQKLGFSYSPSAFQGRLGEAKGLWVVDYSNRSKDDWIEVYPSQQKWERSTKRNGESDDPSHRTFELLKCSGPLRSADLNTQFLPLLMDRAKDKRKMKDALSELLKQGLAQEVAIIREAVEDPLSFRLWVRSSNSNVKERLKNGSVAYHAGLPVSMEERLNVMLDAGFQPKGLRFMSELTMKLFKSHAEELKKRLNIKVGKSTYAYMVPDFWDVLEPGEVFIDFSEFIDGVSGFSGALLKGVDVIVARSPAHFVSDVQKVKSVVKAELMGLKDVIVFPTRGNPSLAAKLSGGDYDGDIAWVCWDESIVNNFVTADVPDMPDLVKEGLLRKDSTTYEKLVEGQVNTTSLFLRKAFDFNTRESMLGICTNWKERVCYTHGNVNSNEARYLSKLLSDLVDAPKQGFIFGEDDWRSFKKTVVKTVPGERKWKPGDPSRMANHINDHLMCVAEKTIEKAISEIYKNLGEAPYYDDDLAEYHKLACRHAMTEPAWKVLLDQLIADITILQEKWKKHFVRPDSDESKPEFLAFVVARYEEFRDIHPHVDNVLTQSLLSEYSGTDELSNWELLKASTIFSTYGRSYVSNFVWWVAGKQLCALKAKFAKGGPPHPIVPGMYITLKPDSAIIKRLMSHEYPSMVEGSGSVGNAEELEALQDED